MYALKTDPGLCRSCETVDCLMKCQYIDLTLGEAKEERRKIIDGEDSLVLRECVTCYACEEYCPVGNHPFYQLVELQEARGVLPVPDPLVNLNVKMWGPRGDVDYKRVQSPVIHMCGFQFFESSVMTGKLFEGASVIGGNDTHCSIMYSHFAKLSITKERLPQSIKNIQEYYLQNNNIKEIICFHDECVGTYLSFAPAYGIEVPFKPIHFFEFLRDRLKLLKNEIAPLNVKAAYQRPCSNRLYPNTDQLVDEICQLIGVTRVERTYDRENALCCGAAPQMLGKDTLADEVQEKNLNDMVEHEAEYCIFSCPYCLLTLEDSVTKRGMKPIFLSDLCKVAMGEATLDLDALAEELDLMSM